MIPPLSISLIMISLCAFAVRAKIYILHEPLNSFRIRNDSNTSQVMNGDKKMSIWKNIKRLVERYAKELHLSRWQVNLSVMIRRLMSFLRGIYLKDFCEVTMKKRLVIIPAFNEVGSIERTVEDIKKMRRVLIMSSSTIIPWMVPRNYAIGWAIIW